MVMFSSVKTTNVTSSLLMIIRSTKYDLIIKLITQMDWKLPNEYIKPN
jgi:hypothetical protein